MRAAAGSGPRCARGDPLPGLPPEDAERLRAFATFFADERAHAERLPVEVLLERGLEGTGYDLAVLARASGERRLANLRKLMRLAREYERAEGRDLHGFLAYAATRDFAAAREGEAPLESEGLDAVRLMTIHRAKGLEFPVVCVADLGRQGAGQRDRLLIGPDGRDRAPPRHARRRRRRCPRSPTSSSRTRPRSRRTRRSGGCSTSR